MSVVHSRCFYSNESKKCHMKEITILHQDNNKKKFFLHIEPKNGNKKIISFFSRAVYDTIFCFNKKMQFHSNSFLNYALLSGRKNEQKNINCFVTFLKRLRKKQVHFLRQQSKEVFNICVSIFQPLSIDLPFFMVVLTFFSKFRSA